MALKGFFKVNYYTNSKCLGTKRISSQLLIVSKNASSSKERIYVTDANHGTNWEIDRLKIQINMVLSIKFSSGIEISADWLNKFASAFTNKKSSHAPSELSSNQQSQKNQYKNEQNQSNLCLLLI